MNINDQKYNHICVEGVSRCFKKVVNKLVVRGCASKSDIQQCSNSKTCETCDSVNCNTGIFPKGRITCYQCTGSSCEDVTANNIVYKVCANYEENDQCYTVAKSEIDMTRGCKSDTRDNECLDAAEGCVFCSNNNCNNLKYIYDQVLKCHQCTSDDITSECFDKQTSKVFEKCKRQIRYNFPEYCYTQINGNTIKRGCLHDNLDLTLDLCQDIDSDTCSKCNNRDGCNSEKETLDFTCIVCRSDENFKCWDEANTFKGKHCRVSPSSPKEGCFHGIWHGDAIRGCIVDASTQNQGICKNVELKQCNACYKKDCNTAKSSDAFPH
ncbi:prestalk protein-like [Lucilia sericata]|uniref:prestalk protein-like n=1 Tax=Lucilia sericata TaxID=13632 RepID=UPI0018A84B44|nr:prestalk protein-like [Lucilia sericata]